MHKTITRSSVNNNARASKVRSAISTHLRSIINVNLRNLYLNYSYRFQLWCTRIKLFLGLQFSSVKKLSQLWAGLCVFRCYPNLFLYILKSSQTDLGPRNMMNMSLSWYLVLLGSSRYYRFKQVSSETNHNK